MTRSASAVGEERPRRASSDPPKVVWLMLGLRALMETGIVLGLAYWGYETGASAPASILLAIAAPVVGFGFWGAIDFHQAGRAAESLRLAQELAVTGLTALALFSTGQSLFGLLMLVLSLVYHGLVYATGQRLLRTRAAS